MYPCKPSTLKQAAPSTEYQNYEAIKTQEKNAISVIDSWVD